MAWRSLLLLGMLCGGNSTFIVENPIRSPNLRHTLCNMSTCLCCIWIESFSRCVIEGVKWSDFISGKSVPIEDTEVFF